MNSEKNNYIITNNGKKLFYNADIFDFIKDQEYTTKQKKFHHHIDKISSIMVQPSSSSPQITRGNAIDVTKLIVKLGSFVNPSNKNYMFENDTFIDTSDTLEKLNILKTLFEKYCLSKIPYQKNIEEYLWSIYFIIEEIIRIIKKKEMFIF